MLFLAAPVLPRKSPLPSGGDDRRGGREGIIGRCHSDAITALMDGREIKVRLHGIDAPEKGQPSGSAAKEALSKLAFGKVVTIQPLGRDRYGRTIAELLITGGDRVSVTMVKAGMAWHFAKYAPYDSELAAAEVSARAKKRGLWADPAPVAPWDWRKR